MVESSSGDGVYRNVLVETLHVEGYTVVSVEVPSLHEGRYKRSHQRIVAGVGTAADGQTVIYSDTYTDAPRPTTFAYARHDVDQQAFLSLLEEFIGSAILIEFPELRNSPARCVVQTVDDLQQVEFGSYSEAITSMKALPLLFARFYFAFGDMTVDFTDHHVVVRDELASIDQRILRRAVASPLMSFNASNSEIWASFLLSVHCSRFLSYARYCKWRLR
jgi:hypothetical protein